MGHLERREALPREIPGPAHHLHAVARPPETDDEERLVQERRDVEDAQARVRFLDKKGQPINKVVPWSPR